MAILNNSDIFFLVTTSNEEFWDKNSKIIFLGEWCKLESRKKIWSAFKSYTYPYIWSDRKEYEIAYKYCNNLLEDILPYLTNKLNDTHGINKSKQYYRIILGEWLIHYIYQLYDKYCSLYKIIKQYPNISTYSLKKEQYYIPADYSDFIKNVTKDDRYALQLYSGIACHLGINVTEKKISKPLRKIHSTPNQLTWKNKFKTALYSTLSFLNKSFYKEHESITLTEPYFCQTGVLLKIILKSKFRCIFDDMNHPFDMQVTPSYHLRNSLSSEYNSEDHFKNYIIKQIFYDIPLIFLEGYSSYRNIVLNLPIRQSKIFYTANANYGNNCFKFFVAEHSKYIKLILGQHGGVNGTHLMALEEADQKFCDYFWTFGWKDNYKQIPMCHYNMSMTKKNFKYVPKKNLILLVMTGQSRFHYRFHSSYSAFEFLDYISDTKRFIGLLDFNLDLIIRLYSEDYKWSVSQRLQIEKAACKAYFDSRKKTFLEQLAKVEMLVTDHIGSSYLESIALNVPTVVFCDPNITKFRETAKPFYNEFIKIKIFHTTPDSAAEHINSIQLSGILNWWFSSDVQNARIRFIHSFARVNQNWINNWISEFNRVLEEDEF